VARPEAMEVGRSGAGLDDRTREGVGLLYEGGGGEMTCSGWEAESIPLNNSPYFCSRESSMPNEMVVNMSALPMGLFPMPAPHVYVFLLRRLMYRRRTKNTKRPRKVTAETTAMPAIVAVERRGVCKALVDTDTGVGLAEGGVVGVGVAEGGGGTTGGSSEDEAEDEDWVSLVVEGAGAEDENRVVKLVMVVVKVKAPSEVLSLGR
jgi:hypothetical protein